MRRWMALFVLALAVTTTAVAQDAQLKRLDSGADAAGWEAVGRLNVGGTGFCTGALIAPDLVLTAGHCLFDKETGDRIDHTQVEFLAGWRNGRASAYRNVRRAVVHPDYTYAGHVKSEGVRNDLALLELEHPIRDGKIMPFDTAARPPRGAKVGVVSYATGRSEAPSLQELCRVLAQQDGLLVTSCSVEFGSSGAPIFVIDKGRVQIVSVVSAKAEVEGKAVSLGTSLGAPLARLQAELVAQRDDISPRISGGMRRDTGAKFIKP
ncbi:trypsin-like serine protease [Tateyamaria sp. ANG-S1]|uniref:trypsin-like serine peptidase n=1 Tax=Tateyamaria sp. ANG-S1 TaxID=1577905 RepID=UPI00057E79CC|nr:trypsin-like serine protease [Tateyamaria sp. ANG-S1]KIC51749.1 trypsin [Tateyamaria sp. ANG-S1]